ncbi:nucleotidyltransferase domain-containing protein [Pseudoruegeria sp. HB172150]|uniref:nucleotidyltransferase domain-containing protein n=1 Tax=Pseudoruegeria sp. HB172150 TaxID=2721164 RepID=UPI0015516BCB|nr:nucleotidyltransferase domain-containing protein [Pseudoruegeria sp. HB172150]
MTLAPETEQALADFLRNRFGTALLVGALTGSHANGWATPRSDYDLIAIVAPDPTGQSPDRRYEAEVFQGVPVETLVVTLQEAQRICALRAAPSFRFTKSEDILRMEKFASAHVLIGAPLWSDLLAMCSPRDYAAKLADRHWRIAAKFFDDMCGALDQEETDLAVDACRAMLREEVEALLCHTGDTNGRRKWMARRIAAAVGISTEIKADFRRFHFLYDLGGEAELLPWVQRAISFHHTLQSAVLWRPDMGGTTGGTARPSGLFPSGPLFVWQIDEHWAVKSITRELVLPQQHVALLLPVMAGQSAEPSAEESLVEALINAGLLTRGEGGVEVA